MSHPEGFLKMQLERLKGCVKEKQTVKGYRVYMYNNTSEREFPGPDLCS